jgi:hypothetical protein
VLLFVLLVFAVICAPRLAARLGAWARDSEGSAGVAAGAPLDEHPALAAAGLPVNLELVVIVEDLASLRRTAEGRAMAALLGEAGVTEPLDKSWEVLAQRLGLTPGEAVDRLLGRRVVLAIRDGAGGGGGAQRAGGGARRWTLISEIDDKTAEVLRTKLDVSPRTVVKGQQVYAVEGGNLDLALHWRGEDRVTLLLGPSDAPDLLNDLIVAAITPLPEGETMTRSPVLDESRRLGPADVVVLGRVDPPTEEARADAPHWDNFVVLNLRREPGAGAVGGGDAGAVGSSLGGFSARIILRDASAWNGLAGVGAWSDGPVRAAGDAMAAVVEATPARTPAPDSAGPLGAILSALAPPAEISGRATGRRAMFILPRKQGEALGFDGAAGAGGVRLAVAAELTDLAGAAPAIDALIAERIGDAERLLGSGAPRPTIAAGVPLRAARVEQMRLPEGNPVETIVGGRPVVAWTYRPAPGMVRGGEGDARDGGWCVLTLSAADGSAAATAQHVADLLTVGGEGGEGRRWLSVGHLSPSEILAPVRELPWLKGVRGIAEHVGRIEWRLEVTDLLDVEGEASVRLAEPKGK